MFRISCLAAIASLLLAGTAHAAFDSPLDEEVSCNEPNAAYNNLSDPNTVFVEYSESRCLSLCKRVVKDCKQYVKDAASCRLALNADYLFYFTTNCDEFQETPEGERACKSDAREFASSQSENIKSLRDGYLDACEGWGEMCQLSCGGDL